MLNKEQRKATGACKKFCSPQFTLKILPRLALLYLVYYFLISILTYLRKYFFKITCQHYCFNNFYRDMVTAKNDNVLFASLKRAKYK